MLKEGQMRNLKDQTGSVFIVVLLLAVILVAVGFAVYTSIHAKKTSPVANDATPTPATSVTSTPTVARPTSEFDVPELTFKMTLPAGLNGLTYSVETSLPSTAPNGSSYRVSTARFSTQYLQQAGCSTSAGPVGIGSISRYPFDPHQVQTTNLGTIKQVGNYYLEFSSSQAYCSTTYAAVNANQSSMMQLLSQAFSAASPL
jgi:hypothetical protein